MNRQTWLVFSVFTAVCAAATIFATQQLMARQRLEHQNTQLLSVVEKLGKEQEASAARIAELQQSVESAKAREETLRQEAARQARVATQLQEQAAERRSERETSFKTECFDSDAKLGAGDIYVQGSVRIGGVQLTDHCRLESLVEFYCLENPRGSGHFISDARMVSCPDGSRCVSGECLR